MRGDFHEQGFTNHQRSKKTGPVGRADRRVLQQRDGSKKLMAGELSLRANILQMVASVIWDGSGTVAGSVCRSNSGVVYLFQPDSRDHPALRRRSSHWRSSVKQSNNMFLHISFYYGLKLMGVYLASSRKPADKYEAYPHSSCGNVYRNNSPLFSLFIMIKYRKKLYRIGEYIWDCPNWNWWIIAVLVQRNRLSWLTI